MGLFAPLLLLLLLGGCTSYAALPATVPAWLVVALLFVNRPTLKWVWNVLTGLLVFPLIAALALNYDYFVEAMTGAAPQQTTSLAPCMLLHIVSLLGLGLAWVLPNVSSSSKSRILALILGGGSGLLILADILWGLLYLAGLVRWHICATSGISNFCPTCRWP